MSISVVASSNSSETTTNLSLSSSVPESVNPQVPEPMGAISSDAQLQQRVEVCRKRALTPAKVESQTSINLSGATVAEPSEADGGVKKISKHKYEDCVASQKSAVVHQVQSQEALAATRGLNRPLIKLSVNLLKTYESINTSYYEKKALGKQTQHLLPPLEGRVIKLGESHLKIGALLGKGSFGSVHEATLKKMGSDQLLSVAFKINKLVRGRLSTEYARSIKTEADIFKKIQEVDKSDEGFIAQVLDYGFISEDQCFMVQPLYSYNLYKMIQNTNHRGISLRLTYKIASQLLTSLLWLRHPKINLVHTDIKPENIVLENPKRSKIRLIDFGLARAPTQTANPSLYICSRFYRSPEAIFGMPFDQNLDTWSAGCVIYELHSGRPLFPAKDSEELIYMIYELLGSPDESFVKQIRNWEKFFTLTQEEPKQYKPIFEASSTSSRNRLDAFNRDLCNQRAESGIFSSSLACFHTPELYDLFKQFIRAMIAWNPSDRVHPRNLSSHPFMVKISQITSEQELQEEQKALHTKKSEPSDSLHLANRVDEQNQETAQQQAVVAAEHQKTVQKQPQEGAEHHDSV